MPLMYLLPSWPGDSSRPIEGAEVGSIGNARRLADLIKLVHDRTRTKVSAYSIFFNCQYVG